jgi:hypothetical protein
MHFNLQILNVPIFLQMYPPPPLLSIGGTLLQQNNIDFSPLKPTSQQRWDDETVAAKRSYAGRNKPATMIDRAGFSFKYSIE